jgi:NADP-dependent 3-hydroxy acid dehydrogenase YdfG
MTKVAVVTGSSSGICEIMNISLGKTNTIIQTLKEESNGMWTNK